MALSVMVLAGAAQFTAVSLISENTPIFIVIVTSVAVNLRMAMYSASLVPHVGSAKMHWRALIAYGMSDQSYGVAIQRYETHPKEPVMQRVAYFMGSIWVVAPVWYFFTFLGSIIGGTIPPEYALDFAVPITFIALFAPALRTTPHKIAAFVSIVVSLLCAGVPYSLGILIAGLCAMVAGAEAERQLSTPKAAS
jgi:predicted branched-subunit amino acid permease